MSKEQLTRDQFMSRLSLLDPGRPVGIYLDFPFCYKKCGYCNLHPIVMNKQNPVVEKYYQFMRDSLDSLSKQKLPPLRAIFMGGGSPNFMDATYMEEVFSHIEFWEDIEHRIIECHPTLLTDAWVELILRKKFTKVCLGVQSIVPEVLKANNRMPVKLERLQYLIDTFQSNGIHVSIDLMAFISSGDYSTFTNDPERFRYDIHEIMKMRPHVLDIYAEWESCQLDREPEPHLTEFHQIIHDECETSEYKVAGVDIAATGAPVITSYGGLRNNAKAIRKDVFENNEQWSFAYSSASIYCRPGGEDVIAIGGLRGKHGAYGSINGVPYTSRLDIDGKYCINWGESV